MRVFRRYSSTIRIDMDFIWYVTNDLARRLSTVRRSAIYLACRCFHEKQICNPQTSVRASRDSCRPLLLDPLHLMVPHPSDAEPLSAAGPPLAFPQRRS